MAATIDYMKLYSTSMGGLRKAVRKIIEWLWRYGPAEAAATLGGYFVALAASQSYTNEIAVSYLASVADSVIFYLWNFGREILHVRRRRPGYGPGRVGFVALRNCVIEFGPAHALNSSVVQPWGIYFIAKFTGSITLGFFAGTLLAEGGFYLFVLSAYELRKRFLAD